MMDAAEVTTKSNSPSTESTMAGASNACAGDANELGYGELMTVQHGRSQKMKTMKGPIVILTNPRGSGLGGGDRGDTGPAQDQTGNANLAR